MSNEETGYTFGMVRIHSDPTKVADKSRPHGAQPGAQSGEPEDLLFAVESAQAPLETPFVETPADASGTHSTDWEMGATDLLDEPPPPEAPPPAPRVAASPPAKAAKPARSPQPSSAPLMAVMRLSEPPASGHSPSAPATPVVKPRQGGRPKATSSSYILAFSVLASGIGCGAVLWLTLGSLPLAILSASLGTVGAMLAFVMTSR